MTKIDIIRWLKEYIRQQNLWIKYDKEVSILHNKIVEISRPAYQEKKKGIFGCLLRGLLVAILGAIPCAIIIGVLWCVWFLIEVFRVNLKVNQDAVLLPDICMRKVAGIVVENADAFFKGRELYMFLTGCLVIGIMTSCILGVLTFILYIIKDARIPKINKQYNELKEKNRSNLQDLQIQYDKALKMKTDTATILNQMRANPIIPQKYLYSSSITYILECLEDGRADTIKEALNLLHQYQIEQDRYYEMERHHKAMEEENTRIQAELLRNSEAAERIANAAEEAVNLEKRRRREEFYDKLIEQ